MFTPSSPQTTYHFLLKGLFRGEARNAKKLGRALSSRERLSKQGKCMVPMIDTDFLPDRPGKGLKHSSCVFVFAMILATVLMVGEFAWLMVQTVNNKDICPKSTGN
jgi:hypothetical protein